MEKYFELSEYLNKVHGPEMMCKIIAKASDEKIAEMLENYGIW